MSLVPPAPPCWPDPGLLTGHETPHKDSLIKWIWNGDAIFGTFSGHVKYLFKVARLSLTGAEGRSADVFPGPCTKADVSGSLRLKHWP